MALGIGPGDQVICPDLHLLRDGRLRRAARRGAGLRGRRPGDLQRDARGGRARRAALPARACARAGAPLRAGGGPRGPRVDGGGARRRRSSRTPPRRSAPTTRAAAAWAPPATSRCFSFFPTKNLGGFGEGGLVTCHDADVADTLRTLRVHGMKPRYHHRMVGVNARLDALQAAVLRVKLRHVEALARGARAQRRATTRSSSAKAGAAPADVAARRGRPAAALPACGRRRPRATCSTSTWSASPPRGATRCARTSRRRGVGQRGLLPDSAAPAGVLPRPRRARGRASRWRRPRRARPLALPIHPDLSERQREAVAAAVVEFLGGWPPRTGRPRAAPSPAQQELLHLARHGLRQRLHRDEVARHLEAREALAAEAAQLVGVEATRPARAPRRRGRPRPSAGSGMPTTAISRTAGCSRYAASTCAG